MRGSALQDLSDVAGMLLRAEEAQMRELNEREAKLRHALSMIDDNRRAALSLSVDALGPMRGIGADILWQGWIGRNRADLNRQLALCLAQKARHMDRLRRAHGKQQAAKSLLEREIAEGRVQTNRRQVAELDALSLVRVNRR